MQCEWNPHYYFRSNFFWEVYYVLFSLNNKLYIQIHQWGLALIYIPSLKTHGFLKIDVAKQETDFK